MKKSFAVAAALVLLGTTSCTQNATQEAQAEEPEAVQTAAAEEEDHAPILRYMTMDEDTRPVFPGGMGACMKWIHQNLQYPDECRADNVEGTVEVQIIIGTDGSVVEAEVLATPDERLNAEAMRVMKAMPRWKPGILPIDTSMAVSVALTLPVYFPAR